MMILSRLRISLVIPAYNEEGHIARCLDAIARQTVQPFEVIVVDNHSTDRTAEIAAAYSFVRVIREERQGVVYARDTGFNAARGDIIGRIDADVVLPESWVECVRDIFGEGTVDAVTGRLYYYDIACARMANAIENMGRRWLVRELPDSMFLQGGNMAMTRGAWRKVRGEVCHERQQHEDFDLAIHLGSNGFTIAYDESMQVGVSARRADTPFAKGVEYVRMAPYTYAAHQVSHYRRVYLIMGLSLVLYVPARMLFRGYHPDKGRFSLACMLRGSQTRISPIGK